MTNKFFVLKRVNYHSLPWIYLKISSSLPTLNSKTCIVGVFDTREEAQKCIQKLNTELIDGIIKRLEEKGTGILSQEEKNYFLYHGFVSRR